MLSSVEKFDHWAYEKVPSLQKKPFIFLFKLITYTGYARSWLVFVSFLLITQWLYRPLFAAQNLILKATLCTMASYVVGFGMKLFFARRRPHQIFANLPKHIHSPRNDSFPSGHASSWTAFTVALYLQNHPLSLYSAIWTGFVIFSRFFLGVHFPSDLLGGMLLGIACGLLILF